MVWDLAGFGNANNGTKVRSRKPPTLVSVPWLMSGRTRSKLWIMAGSKRAGFGSSSRSRSTIPTHDLPRPLRLREILVHSPHTREIQETIVAPVLIIEQSLATMVLGRLSSRSPQLPRERSTGSRISEGSRTLVLFARLGS